MAVSTEAMVKSAQQQIDELTSQQAEAYIASDKPFIIDVREPAERANGFLPKSDNIPRGVLEFKIQNHKETQDMAAPILVYCQSGMRGALATHTLRQLGYVNAKNLAGGFEAWAASGFSVEKDPDTW